MNRPKTERLCYYDDIDIRLYLTEDPAITETTVVINPEGYISRRFILINKDFYKSLSVKQRSFIISHEMRHAVTQYSQDLANSSRLNDESHECLKHDFGEDSMKVSDEELVDIYECRGLGVSTKEWRKKVSDEEIACDYIVNQAFERGESNE